MELYKYWKYKVVVLLVLFTILQFLFRILSRTHTARESCPPSCSCHESKILCPTITDELASYVSHGYKRIAIADKLQCDDPRLQKLFHSANEYSVEVIGKCWTSNGNRDLRKPNLEHSSKDPPIRKRGHKKPSFKNNRDQRIKSHHFQEHSVYNLQDEPLFSHSCSFRKSPCRWNQLEAIDFLDWKHRLNVGMVLKPDFQYPIGAFADIVSPPLILPTRTRQIKISVYAAFENATFAQISFHAVYPTSSSHMDDISNFHFSKGSTRNVLKDTLYFSPMYPSYSIVVRGFFGIHEPRESEHFGELRLVRIEISPVERYCFSGNGHYYRGEVAKTKYGHACTTWKSTSYTKDKFPEADLTNNFCRNPDSSLARPWCFTKDSPNRRQVCDISKCQFPNTQTSEYPFGTLNPLKIQNLHGLYDYTGRISTYINGKWRSICNPYDSLSHKTINLMCQQTGFGGVGVVWSRPALLNNTYCIDAENIDCPLSKKSFSECTITAPVDLHTFGYEVWLTCFLPSMYNSLTSGLYNLSLMHEKKDNVGAVLVRKHDGQVGTICTSGWDHKSANVVCRQMGYPAALRHDTHRPKKDYPKPLITSIDCRGYESSIDQCVINTEQSSAFCRSSLPATATCMIPHASPSDQCSFIRSYCGWKVAGDLKWIWHRGESWNNPLQINRLDKYFIYVQRNPFDDTERNSKLISPIFRQNSGNKIQILFDYYVDGIPHGQISVSYKLRRDSTRDHIIESRSIDEPTRQFQTMWIEVEDNLHEDFQFEITLRSMAKKSIPTSFVYAIDDLRVNNVEVISNGAQKMPKASLVFITIVTCISNFYS